MRISTLTTTADRSCVAPASQNTGSYASCSDIQPADATNAMPRLQEATMSGACAFFALLGAVATHETYSLAERTALPSWPIWPFQLVIPLVFAVAAFRHGCYARWPSLRPIDRAEHDTVGGTVP